MESIEPKIQSGVVGSITTGPMSQLKNNQCIEDKESALKNGIQAKKRGYLRQGSGWVYGTSKTKSKKNRSRDNKEKNQIKVIKVVIFMKHKIK